MCLLQDALEVGTDADMADIVQEHPHKTANQMFQPRHRYKLTELKENKIRDGIYCVCYWPLDWFTVCLDYHGVNNSACVLYVYLNWLLL